MFCVSCGKRLEPGMKFCPACGAAADWSTQTETANASSGSASGSSVPPPTGSYQGSPRAARSGQLLRPRQGRVVGGVCAAFALQYGWDVVLVRVLTAMCMLFSVGAVAVAYVIAWIVIPEAPFALPTASGR